jgi:RIO kinase 2
MQRTDFLKYLSRYFNRDVECIRTFFKRRFRYESNLYPRFKSTIGAVDADPEERGFRLDIVVAASGFKNSEQKILEEVKHNFQLIRL